MLKMGPYIFKIYIVGKGKKWKAFDNYDKAQKYARKIKVLQVNVFVLSEEVKLSSW